MDLPTRGFCCWKMLRWCERHVSYWKGFIPDAHFKVVLGAHLELQSNVGEIARFIQTALTKAA
jgi:hypothetical protein